MDTAYDTDRRLSATDEELGLSSRAVRILNRDQGAPQEEATHDARQHSAALAPAAVLPFCRGTHSGCDERARHVFKHVWTLRDASAFFAAGAAQVHVQMPVQRAFP
jgi:hypothetical protein